MKSLKFIKLDNDWVCFNPYTYKLLYLSESEKKRISNKIEEKYELKQRAAPTELEPTMLCICTTEACNLNCTYCFADGGTYKSKEEKYITFETMKYGYDKLSSLQKSNLQVISFYGGEPLLNFRNIKKFVDYVSYNNPTMNFGIITNGTLLSGDIVDFLNTHKFAITVSLDGEKKYNDINRISRNGKSTFDMITKNLKYIGIKNRNFSMFAEATITTDYLMDYEKGDFNKFMDTFIDLDFDSVVPFMADIPEGYDDNIKNKIDMFFNDMIEYTFNKLLSEDFLHVPNLGVSVIQAIASKKYEHECLAGYRYLFLTVSGELYPCQLFYAAKKNKVSDRLLDNFLLKPYVRRNDIKECRSCFCEGLCNLYCPGSSTLYNGEESTVIETRCYVQKAITEAVIKNLAVVFKNENNRKTLFEHLLLYSKQYSKKKIIK